MLIEQYQLTEEQLRFTGTPTECIKLSNEDPDRFSILAMDQDIWSPFSIYIKMKE